MSSSNVEPINHTSILFPSASTSLSTTLNTIKRSSLSLPNRLHSIASDASFIQHVSDTLNLPLIANERCGSWYIPTAQKAGSAYFKSTDGHFGQWSFSLRRLNLGVLDVIKREGRGGCIVVDSTRKGKSMPDALSKTVPIWISVLNRLLFPDNVEAGVLLTPEQVVSPSEHAQIEERIPDLVDDVRRLALDQDDLRAKLGGKPMLPVWMTPDMRASDLPLRSGYHRIVLCTASSRSSSSGSLADRYVQGAADDAESWAFGLDAATFWRNSELLLSTPEDDLSDAIRSLVDTSKFEVEIGAPVAIKPAFAVCIGSNATAEKHCVEFDVVIACSEKPSKTVADKMKDRYVYLSCSAGKVGSRQLRSQLPKLHALGSILSPGSKMLVTCPNGKDLAVGIALAIICLHCDGSGAVTSKARPVLNKTEIKHRLSWIVTSVPDAAPSRATLQSVNAFLLG